MNIRESAAQARSAAIELAATAGEVKNRALAQIADALRKNAAAIVAANRQDLERAQAQNLAPPLLKRLRFDEAKIAESCTGLQSLMALPDPVGQTLAATELDDGLELYKLSCPIGIIGVIFESRPDALVQISALCLKSGNAVLLKGGHEAAQTNRILARLIKDTGERSGVANGWLALMQSRADVTEMLALESDIDLIIPRGSNAFVRYIMENTAIPVLGHADGICHLYIDRAADLEMAVALAVDSKCQYVAVCNAVETILVHAALADTVLPPLQQALAAKGVEIRGCEKTRRHIDVLPADESDWRSEYLDYIVSIRVVETLEAATTHINRYGSGHTDVIVTADRHRARRFLGRIDSACAFWNCSSRFSDGFRFGLGAEVGISTSKIHARGPVGLEGLTIYQWRLMGKGHQVGDYTGPQARPFVHRRLSKTYPY